MTGSERVVQQHHTGAPVSGLPEVPAVSFAATTPTATTVAGAAIGSGGRVLNRNSVGGYREAVDGAETPAETGETPRQGERTIVASSECVVSDHHTHAADSEVDAIARAATPTGAGHRVMAAPGPLLEQKRPGGYCGRAAGAETNVEAGEMPRVSERTIVASSERAVRDHQTHAAVAVPGSYPGKGSDPFDGRDPLTYAASVQRAEAPAPREFVWYSDQGLSAKDWPGIDLDFARVRQMPFRRMLEQPGSEALSDPGAMGAGCLVESGQDRVSSISETKTQTTIGNPLDPCAAHFGVQFDSAGRAPLAQAARHLGISPGDDLSLQVRGTVFGQPLVVLVRGSSGEPVGLATQGRLTVPKGTQNWLQSIWGLPAHTHLTISGPGRDGVLAYVSPSHLLGRSFTT